MATINDVRKCTDWGITDLVTAKNYAQKSGHMFENLDDVRDLSKVCVSLAAVNDVVADILKGTESGLTRFVQHLAERRTEEGMPALYVAMTKGNQDKYGEIAAAMAACQKLANTLRANLDAIAPQVLEARAAHKTAMNKVVSGHDVR